MATTDSTVVRVGQRVYSGLYGGRYGIVYRIHGEQSPESVRSLGGGCIVIGGRASFDIVFDDGSRTQQLPESILRGVQWKILEEVVTASDINAALSDAEQEEARRDTQRKATEARRTAERIEHAKNYPHLTKAKDKPEWSPGRIAAANIRTELKRAFPKVKFSVKSDYNSVDIKWTCGPTAKQVEEITSKYKGGSFNGMEDIYERDHDATFAEVFGSPNYVFCVREYPQDALEACWRFLAEHYKVPYEAHNTRWSGEYIPSIAYRVLAHHELPNGLHGFKRDEAVTCGLVEEFWIAY